MLILRYLSLIAFGSLALLLTSCGRYATETTGSQLAARESAWENQAGAEPPSRKVLYSSWLDVMVPEPDSAVAQTLRLAEAYGGFMSNSATGSATIRVPAERLEAAISEISAMGKLRDKRLSGRDVTEEYLDLGIRLENAEKARARYLELLSQAESVEAALQVERELERLNETIDLIKGRRNRMDQLERYATITVNFSQQPKLGPLGYVFSGLYKGLRWLFVRGDG